MRKKSITTKCKAVIDDTPNPPDTVDWTKKGMTDVQNQGTCGASWAFAATGALEGLYAQTKGKLVKLSDQNLLDCSDDYGNQGCNGGLFDQAFQYVIDNGIATNETYPYIGQVQLMLIQDQRCVFKPTMKFLQIKDCAEVPSGSYSKLVSAVIQQPVASAVESSKFKFYKEGVFDGNCTDDIDAGVLIIVMQIVIIGYGTTDDSKDYWKLKNSLGTDWGINGMMLLSRGNKTDGSGKCGIQLLAAVPRTLA